MTNNMNKKFYELPNEMRFKQGDSTSRRAFAAYCTENNIIFLESGITGNPVSKKCYQEPLLTKIPDLLCKASDGYTYYTEVKGCGNRGVNIKCENLDYYEKWSWPRPLKIFIYNSATNKYVHLPFYNFKQAVDYTASIFSHFDENRNRTEVFFNVPCNSFDWHDMPANFEHNRSDNYHVKD